MEKEILAYVSQYQEKYFWNDKMGQLPESIKKEILMNLIFIVEEAGGVCELGFDEWGDLYIDTYCEEGDLGYDQISARLLIAEMERNQQEVLEELNNWHRLISRE